MTPIWEINIFTSDLDFVYNFWMKKIILIISFIFITFINSQSWALPPCQGGYNKNTWTNCFGTYIWMEGKFKGDKYVGEFKNGKMQGRGIFTWITGSKYIGEFKDNKRHGYAIYTWANGDKYVGEFKNNKRNGQGIYVFGAKSKWAGDKYVGEYKNSLKHGQGTYTFANGAKDEGEFKNDKLNGYAIRYDKNGNILKEGIWKDDKFFYAKKKEKPTPSSNSKLDRYKNFCAEIGFTPGTEKFGDCVMQLTN